MKEPQTKQASLTALSLILLCGITLGTLLAMGGQRLAPKAHRGADHAATSVAPSGLQELLAFSATRLAQLDLAVMNLLCAEGLPSDESLDVSTTLASLDAWAKRVQSETQRHFYKFQKNPAEFNPPEELALFLSVRGHCLETLGRFAEAQLAHAHAHALAPDSPVYLAFLAGAVKKELPNWESVQIDLGQNTIAERASAKR